MVFLPIADRFHFATKCNFIKSHLKSSTNVMHAVQFDIKIYDRFFVLFFQLFSIKINWRFYFWLPN